MPHLATISATLSKEQQRLEAEIEDLQQQDPSRDSFRDTNSAEDEQAAESEDHSRIQSRLDVSQAQLTAVKKALAKVEAGTYGTCERCGKPIAPARLEAKPWAIYDVECEEALESRR